MEKLIISMLAALMIFSRCRNDDDTIVPVDTYINHDLTWNLLINGQEQDTVYADSLFRIKIKSNMFKANSFEISLDGKVFNDSSFNYTLTQPDRYLVTAKISNGARTLHDTAEIFVIAFTQPNIFLPGLWGESGPEAHFRIAVDTLFFNALFCPNSFVPFAIFADSIDWNHKKALFRDSSQTILLSRYRDDWYFLKLSGLNYWLTAPNNRDFLYVNYGGDYYHQKSSLADTNSFYRNEDFGCYVIKSSYLSRP
jgi:hypothetical protein